MIMTGVREATVEVLTAEVRVLMVGSRQVTLSVARQLDWAVPEHIEPFGRVRISRVDPDDLGRVEVIGSAGGVLARSSLREPGYVCRRSGGLNARHCPEHPGGLDTGFGHVWVPAGEQARWAAWCDLPLIVLAGLR
jgi:hypothetical protein